MCGRFAQLTLPGILSKTTKAKIKLTPVFIMPRYNIPPSTLDPSTYVPVIRIPSGEAQPVLETMKWGLIPVWAKNFAEGYKHANAKAETVEKLNTFRDAFRSRRCFVPVDGFYEWNQETNPKEPSYFLMKDESPFALAGIWQHWKGENKEGKNVELDTFSLITTTPNELIGTIHDRMPVILNEKDFEGWLDPKNNDVERLKRLLGPYPAEKMKGYRVSTYMSNAKNQGPDCIKPL